MSSILPTAYAPRQGEASKSEKKSAIDIVNELRSKAAKTSQTAPQQEAPEAPEAPEQSEATQDNQQQGDKADSRSDSLDKVRSYRKFETERYVNDRLFRDGFLEVLSPAAVKLLLFIGSKCNDDGVCFHAHETMMQLTGLSRNTIKRAIAELIENKLIETKAVAGKSNHYRLL
ncbi:helix-turn-helix domain-containing protein [Escherichia coli]|uniref:helix-turn-helix domain-containing protein n=1 Tax=Escherichia coli TaxID=562 RepID=UPI00136652FB|nr:helix-turn-helix domain-containing protein [Escherichia coli]MWK08795.1 helix-turn-helix domain-containing protein [Escherichia coli]